MVSFVTAGSLAGIGCEGRGKMIVGTIALELESQTQTRQLQTKGFEP